MFSPLSYRFSSANYHLRQEARNHPSVPTSSSWPLRVAVPTLSRSSSRTIPWSIGTATSATQDLSILSSSVGIANYTAAGPAPKMLEGKLRRYAPLSAFLSIPGLAGPEPHASEARNERCQLLVLVNVGDRSSGRLRASLWETPLKQNLHLNALVQLGPFYFTVFFLPPF